MDAAEYFAQIEQGLIPHLGTPRRTRKGVHFGSIGLEYECIGATMLIFLDTLNWHRSATWDGAIHLDWRHTSVTTAVAQVQEMIERGRRRVGNIL